MPELSCYEYVTVPYEQVRDALMHEAGEIFQRATAHAAHRAHELVATLRAQVGAIEVGADVSIVIVDRRERQTALGDRAVEIDLRWKAARAAGLFPALEATLSAYPLSAHETQIALRGAYRVPLGVVGQAIDAVVGYRIAQASVLRFVKDVAARLNAELR